jgi:hypothetical protein
MICLERHFSGLSDTSVGLILGLSLAAFIVVLATIIVIYRRKNSRQQTEYSSLQIVTEYEDKDKDTLLKGNINLAYREIIIEIVWQTLSILQLHDLKIFY